MNRCQIVQGIWWALQNLMNQVYCVAYKQNVIEYIFLLNFVMSFASAADHQASSAIVSKQTFYVKNLYTIIREGGQHRGSSLNSNKSIFKITYISTWKHELLSLATWEITNFELEFLKYNWFILCFLLLFVLFLKNLTDTNQIEKASQSSYIFL